jgi:ADP-ribose pyrophosphatase
MPPDLPADDQLLLQTQRFRVVRRRQPELRGGTLAREIVLHPGAVVVIPLLPRDHVCLIRNFRVAVERTLIELPAGTIDPPEQPEATAARELTEETGYRAARLTALPSFLMSPGILNERMYGFAAHDLTPGPPRREEGEQIENLVVPWCEAIAMSLDGRIEDAKTIAALLMWDRLRER